MVCLAGGSGVTPFMSMIREVTECGLDREIFLFYGSKDLEDMVFHDALTRIAERHANIRYLPVIENPPAGYDGLTGLITAELIEKQIGDIGEKTFYLCGPQGMYDFCAPEIRKLGVPMRKIRKEAYGPPLSVWKSVGWPEGVEPDRTFEVTVSGKGTIEAEAGTPLLVSLEKAGIVVPAHCRSGECSMCRAKLVSGKVFQPEGALLRKSDRRFGYIHTCVSYPLENLTILL